MEEHNNAKAHGAMGGIDEAILSQCAELGLTSARTKRLAAAADPPSLTWVLGLDAATIKPLKSRRWLWTAVHTSNVICRDLLTSEGWISLFNV